MIVTNTYIDSGSGTRKRYGWNNKPWYQHHVNSSEITFWHFFISVTDGHWLYFRPHVLPTKGLWVHNWNFEICCPSNLHCDTVMLQFCTCQGSWRVQNCNLIGWSYFIKILIRNASQGFTNSDLALMSDYCSMMYVSSMLYFYSKQEVTELELPDHLTRNAGIWICTQYVEPTRQHFYGFWLDFGTSVVVTGWK